MSEYDFNRVPDWPAFEVTLDDVSGRIPVTKMGSWREFGEALETSFFTNREAKYVFRGQRRYDYALSPSLGRVGRAGIITAEIAEFQAEEFARSVRGRISDHSLVDPDEIDELWAIGQHHGLHTPLLDFTYSPFVALFFAFEREDPRHEDENPYRVIHVIDKAFISQDDICPEIRVIEPRKDEYGRLVNQAGLFIKAPYGNTIENVLVNSMHDDDLINIDQNSEAAEIARYICKIYIANENRDECLRNLRRMNVHHASLFPDLLGSSEYCNILVAEEALHRSELAKVAEKEQEYSTQKIEKGVEKHDDAVGTEAQKPEDVGAIADILREPGVSSQLEPGRIEVISDELESSLGEHLVVDWTARDSAKAKLRIVAKNVLRRYGYPPNERDAVIEKIIQKLEVDASAKELPKPESDPEKAVENRTGKTATKKKAPSKRK